MSMPIKKYQKDGIAFYRVNEVGRDEKNRRIQRRKSGLKSMEEARMWQRKLIKEIEQEKVKRIQEGPLWGRLIDDWEVDQRFAVKALKDTTIIDKANALRMYTEEWLDLPVSEINRRDVRRVIDSMEMRGKSRSRRKEVKSGINSVFNWAIEDGLILSHRRSPAEDISLGKKSERIEKVLNQSQIKKFLALAKSEKHPWYPVWAMAVMTGMRNGELYALTWDDVDFERKRIMVSKAFDTRTKSIKSTKSGNWREVPINEQMEKLLRDLKLEGRA